MRQPVLETYTLTRRFGALKAVDALALANQPAEIFGLMGPNGGGKSTTIKMLTTPLFFASNAIYPISMMPRWLQLVSRLNPLTYEVDALRVLLLAHAPSTFGVGLDFGVLFLARDGGGHRRAGLSANHHLTVTGTFRRAD